MVFAALPPPVAQAVAPQGPSATALVHAAMVQLSRSRSFKTVTTSVSLREVAVVEPRLHREAATSHVDGPAGHGVLRVVVAGGAEYLEGDARGLRDLLHLVHASPIALASVGTLAGSWFVEPARQAALVARFGPSLRGIGHVFCTGAGCGLAGATVVARPPGEVVVAVPAFGGDLLLDATHHLRPVALVGTGAQRGLTMRFAYPGGPPPPIRPPSGALPAPSDLTG